MNDDDFTPEMPTIEARYLIDLLFEIGPSIGEHALTHFEIESFQRNTGICLSGWESRTLKTLSNEYMAELYKARKPDAQPPWKDMKVTEDMKKARISKIKNLF